MSHIILQAQTTELNVWISKPGYNGDESGYFVNVGIVTVSYFKT